MGKRFPSLFQMSTSPIDSDLGLNKRKSVSEDTKLFSPLSLRTFPQGGDLEELEYQIYMLPTSPHPQIAVFGHCSKLTSLFQQSWLS